MELASGLLLSNRDFYNAFYFLACSRTGLETYLQRGEVRTEHEIIFTKSSPWFDIPCWALLPSPGEFFPMTGEDIGGPETGVPGLEPMGRGEFISPPPGLDIGNDVAGDMGLGLTPGPGCCLPAG